jgi:hypothetical protein
VFWVVGSFVVLAAIGAIFGSGSSDTGSSPGIESPHAATTSTSATTTSTATTKPSPSATETDKAAALSVWKSYVRRLVRRQSATLGGTVGKLTAKVDNPTDYGQGYKQVIGTAYAELQLSGGKRGTILSAELDENRDGSWLVKPGSLEQKAP